MRTQLYIDGQWVDGNGTLDVIDPSDGSVIAKVATAGDAEIEAALAAADRAAPAWAKTAPRVRAEILRKAFELMTQEADYLAELISKENGKALPDAKGEVAYAAEFFRWFSEEAVRISGDFRMSPSGDKRILVTHQPIGLSILITPWNFPAGMATRKIGPAIAAGCTMILKPAGETPLTALAIVDILDRAGVPKGVVNLILPTPTGPAIAKMLHDKRVKNLSFTGSTEVGRIILKEAADNVIRCSMELGGNAPFVVFEDADLDKAVEGAMAAKFRNIGQACTGANRFIVHADVAEAFTAKVTEKVKAMKIGRGTEEGVTIGPLIDDRAVAKCDELVTEAVSRGAVITTGGKVLDGAGSFYEPTVVTNVQPGSDILTDEIFGPVLSIITFTDEEEAIRLANDTEYGLASYVFTKDLARGQRLIERLEAGMMGLNVGVMSNASAPFGGIKMSGLGREGGFEGIHEYLSPKYTMTPNPFA